MAGWQDAPMVQPKAAWEAAPKGAPPMDPKQFAPDDPGAMMSALIGAGWTFDRISKGMQQLYYGGKSKFESPTLSSLVVGKPSERKLAELKDVADEEERLYKPLQDKHPIATAIGETLPALAIPVGGTAGVAATAGKLAAAGAVPGMLEYGSAGERAKRGAIGAAGAVAGGVVVPKVVEAAVKGVPAVARATRAAVEPLTEKGRATIAGRTLVNAAGDDAGTVAQRLAQAAEAVPGSMPTAAQVAENGGIAALERSVSSAQPAEFTRRGLEQAAARTRALEDIAGDAGKKELFRGARQKTAEDLYERAYSVPVEMENLTPAMRGEVQKLMQMPAIQAALKVARQNAANHGMKLDGTGNIAGLHHAKLAMDDMISELTGATGAQANKAKAIEAARNRLVTFMEKMSPDYGEARATYAAMSKPINQMDVGQTLLEKMRPAITDHGGLARENANAYAGALRNGDQIVKQATGRDMKFADVMDPQHIETFGAVARDLARKANAQDLGRGVGSDTFQKLALSNIAERSGAPGVVGTALDMPGVSKVAKFLYREPEEKIQTLIAQSLLQPKTAAQLMEEAIKAGKPQPIGNILFSNPSRAAQLTGAAPALATTELLQR